MALILGLDPGFSSIGYAVVQLLAKQTHVLECGVITTEKGDTKLVSEDNLNRAQDIHAALSDIIRRFEKQENDRFRAICAESMSFPRSSSVAAKMAMCWGVIAGLAYNHAMPVYQITPQKLKKEITGEKTASKEQVQESIIKVFGAAIPLKGKIPKGKLEHPYDALGAVLALEATPELKLIRNLPPEAEKLWK